MCNAVARNVATKKVITATTKAVVARVCQRRVDHRFAMTVFARFGRFGRFGGCGAHISVIVLSLPMTVTLVISVCGAHMRMRAPFRLLHVWLRYGCCCHFTRKILNVNKIRFYQFDKSAVENKRKQAIKMENGTSNKCI